jgi:Flp pilus assembly protein protease CpaA
MQYILYILTIPFLYFNYKIIKTDLKIKKIPNKYLGYLLGIIPFYYIYLFFNFPEIDYFIFILQIIIAFIISFLLYYYWIWAAWDAKYLLVLSLFIPNIWIIPFIWNIALFTLLYLILYFLWFYLWKIIINSKWRRSFPETIKNDIKDKWKVYKLSKPWNNFYIIIKRLTTFLIIFITIRLARLYLINIYFSENANNNSNILQNIIEKYNIYLFFIIIIIFLLSIYLIRVTINLFKTKLNERYNINYDLIFKIFINILSILLITFIIYEYIMNPYEIKDYLFKILTLYISIYIFFIIIKYAYNITFWISEKYLKNLKDLKKWDIVDKSFLIDLFWKQSSLGYSNKPVIPGIKLMSNYKIKLMEIEKNYAIKKNRLLFPNPKTYISSLWIITDEDVSIIKKMYRITNNYHYRLDKNFQKNNTIKLVKTFPFWIYILLWFLLTYFFWNLIIKYILSFLFSLFENLF